MVEEMGEAWKKSGDDSAVAREDSKMRLAGWLS